MNTSFAAFKFIVLLVVISGAQGSGKAYIYGAKRTTPISAQNTFVGTINKSYDAI